MNDREIDAEDRMWICEEISKISSVGVRRITPSNKEESKDIRIDWQTQSKQGKMKLAT